MKTRSRAPPFRINMLKPMVTSCQYSWRDLRPSGVGLGTRGTGGYTCIPDEVTQEVRLLLEELDLFLGQGEEESMKGLQLEMRLTRLVINGHIPLPSTLMVAAEFLGKFDTSSLPHGGTDEPFDGRNYWSTVGAIPS